MTGRDRRRDAALLCLTGATLVAVLAACGGPAQPTGPGEAPSPGATPGTASPSTVPSAASGLTIVHRDGGKRSTWRLTCSPAGGTHPNPSTACEVLEANDGAALRPVDPSTLCTQVYAGPDTATVKGTWRGQDVSSRFKLTNGCEIARWEALVGLLPPISS